MKCLLKIKRQFTLLAALLVLSTAVFADQSPMRLNADELHWKTGSCSYTKGPQFSLLLGDLHKPGLFIMMVKFPPNFKLLPHWYDTDEHSTILKGTMYAGFGDSINLKEAKAVHAGGFLFFPARQHHFGVTGPEGATVELVGIGPWAAHFVNPSDDPCASK